MPSEVEFEPCSPRYGPLLVLVLMDTNNAQSGLLLAIFWPFLRYIVELEGKKELFVTRKSRCTCSVATERRSACLLLVACCCCCC